MEEKAYANKHQEKGFLKRQEWRKRFFWELVSLSRMILGPKGFKIPFIESLILAQDERWRRA